MRENLQTCIEHSLKMTPPPPPTQLEIFLTHEDNSRIWMSYFIHSLSAVILSSLCMSSPFLLYVHRLGSCKWPIEILTHETEFFHAFVICILCGRLKFTTRLANNFVWRKEPFRLVQKVGHGACQEFIVNVTNQIREAILKEEAIQLTAILIPRSWPA